MITRLISLLPLTPVDAILVRALTAMSPRVEAYACVPDCGAPRPSGVCNCSNGCWATRYVDDCTGAFCYCDTCPSPPC